MDVSEVLLELFGRLPPLARSAVDGLDVEQLTEPLAPGANPIAWLVWHLARVEDHQIADVFDVDQVWAEGAWASSFGVLPDPQNMGYGHTPADVATIRPERPEALLDYLDAVDRQTTDLLADLVPSDLDRIVDRNWDPPVTLGVRLVSVADDCLQHAGQANYLRGLLRGAP